MCFLVPALEILFPARGTTSSSTWAPQIFRKSCGAFAFLHIRTLLATLTLNSVLIFDRPPLFFFNPLYLISLFTSVFSSHKWSMHWDTWSKGFFNFFPFLSQYSWTYSSGQFSPRIAAIDIHKTWPGLSWLFMFMDLTPDTAIPRCKSCRVPLFSTSLSLIRFCP